MKLFVICGEISGNEFFDELFDHIFSTIKVLNIDCQMDIQGIITNEVAKKFNIKQIFSPDRFSMLGIGDIIMNYVKLLDDIEDIVCAIVKFQPDLVISIDSYELSMRILKKTQKLLKNKTKKYQNYKYKIKFWHIVAPSVWAYWPKRTRIVSKIYDRLFYLFPFETAYFKPLERKCTRYNKSFISTFIGCKQAYQVVDCSIKKDKKLIGFMIGSRKGEIKRHKNLILFTILKLKMIDDAYRFIIFATENTINDLKIACADLNNIKYITNNEEKKIYIQKCAVIVAKNGINNIEIGALQTAMLTFYKTSRLTSLFIKKFVKIKFFNLINILLNYENIPEFMNKHATSDNLFKMTYYLLTHEQARNMQIKNSQKAISMLKVENKKYPIEMVSDEFITFLKNYESGKL